MQKVPDNITRHLINFCAFAKNSAVQLAYITPRRLIAFKFPAGYDVPAMDFVYTKVHFAECRYTTVERKAKVEREAI